MSQFIKHTFNKFLFLTLILCFLTNSAFAGGDSGGGGDAQARHVAGEYEFVRAIEFQKFFQLEIYKNMKALSRNPKAQKDGYYGYGLVVEMSKVSLDEEFVSNVKYRIQKEPCLNRNGEASDSSAILPDTVCFSVDRLNARLLSVEEVLPQVTALTTHEITHLMGFGEDRHDEIEALQATIAQHIGKVSTWDARSAYEQLQNNMSEEVAFANIKANTRSSLASLCAATSQVSMALSRTSERIERVQEVVLLEFPIGAEADTLLKGAIHRIIAAQINICGMTAVDPILGKIEELFSDREQVTLFDMTYAINNVFTRISKKDFEAKECGFDSFDCEGEKHVVIQRHKLNDKNALIAELKEAEDAYRNYYRIADKLANDLEARVVDR